MKIRQSTDIAHFKKILNEKCRFLFPPAPSVSKTFLCLFMMSECHVYPAECDANEEEIFLPPFILSLAVVRFICIHVFHIYIFILK